MDLFEKLPINPNEIIYLLTCQACGRLVDERAIQLGKYLFNRIQNRFPNHIKLLSSLLDMLMRFNDIDSAEQLFDSIKNKNVVTYSVMMNGYNVNNEPNKCFLIFEQMKNDKIIPNEVAYTLLINASSKIGMLSRCRTVSDQIPSFLHDNPCVYRSLINMWASQVFVYEDNCFDNFFIGQSWFR